MYAFPKSSRLRQAKEFRETMDGGVKVVCPLVVLFGTPAKASEGRVRFGLVVSKKVGNSVVRNRVKRQLREAFRGLRPELEACGPLLNVDVVAVARVGAKDVDSAVLTSSLKHCLQRLGRAVAAGPKTPKQSGSVT